MRRASHHTNTPRIIYAQWPHDHLVENTIPSMMCVTRGMADMQIADYVVHCQPGDFIMHPPYVPCADGSLPHFEGERANRRCDTLMIYPGTLAGQGVEVSMCHSIGDEHMGGTYIWLKNLLLAQLFQSLYEETKKPYNARSIYHLLHTLIYFIHREVEENRALPTPFQPANHEAFETGSDPIRQACTYIETHLSENLTIREVARLVCLSSSTFSQRFREETGQSFHQFLTAQRLKRAAVMLRETNYKINEIGGYVGLTDAQLRILTKQHWGCTPKEFRNGAEPRR